jgi:hypothetical protein
VIDSVTCDEGLVDPIGGGLSDRPRGVPQPCLDDMKFYLREICQTFCKQECKACAGRAEEVCNLCAGTVNSRDCRNLKIKNECGKRPDCPPPPDVAFGSSASA